MFRIIDKYILKEVLSTWLVVMLTLLGVLLTNQFARILGDVAKDKLPRDAVLDLIFFSGIQYLIILIPIGLFLSILVTLGRLYSNSEMSAMMACRVSAMGIYRPIFLISIPLIILSAWVSIDIGPKSLIEMEKINNEAKRKIDLSSIEPGRFVVDQALGTAIYAEGIGEAGELRNVFLQYTSIEGEIEVVTAKRGNQIETEDENERYFVLSDGKRYTGIPGTTNYVIMEFEEHGIPYELPDLTDVMLEIESLPFQELVRSNDPEKVAEFHWRIAIPISTAILVLLAVPMSKSEPRQGQFSKIFFGIFTFVIYYNLLSAGKAWIEQGVINKKLGLWWVHISILVILGLVIMSQNGYFRRIKRKIIFR